MSKADNLAKFQTTITDGTTSVATSFVTNGSAKAWANIDGAASTPAFRDSLNFSSITDHSAGDQTVTVTSAMANTNYCVNGSCSWLTSSARNIILVATNKTSAAEAPTTTSTRYEIYHYNGAAAYDSTFVMISFNGDLA